MWKPETTHESFTSFLPDREVRTILGISADDVQKKVQFYTKFKHRCICLSSDR